MPLTGCIPTPLDPSRIFRSDPLLTFPAYHHEGMRTQVSIRYVVLRAAEGSARENAARMMEPGCNDSANLVVDEHEAFQCLNDFVIPIGCAPLNTHGLSIVICDYGVERAAYRAARACRQWKIPPRWLGQAELAADFGYLERGTRIPDLPGPLEGGIVEQNVIEDTYALCVKGAPAVSAWFLECVSDFLDGEL